MTTKLLFLVGIIPLLLVPLANAQHSTFAATLYNCGISNPDPTNLLPNSSSVRVDNGVGYGIHGKTIINVSMVARAILVR
jgi:hypothetical protein